MAIGARIIKTGVAVTAAVTLSQLLSLKPTLFAAISAAINVQPSVSQTLRTAKEQISVHLVGVFTALFLGLVLGPNPVTMGLTTIMVIWLCIKLELTGGISMGLVAAIFILDAPGGEFLAQALNRSLVIFLGLSVALTINSLIAPPSYYQRIQENLAKLSQRCAEVFNQAVNDFIDLEESRIEDFPQIQEEANSLLAEGHRQLSLYRSDLGLLPFGRKNKDSKEMQVELWEAYIEYNAGLLEKSAILYDLIPQRVERRKQAGDPPVSPEFQAILQLLRQQHETFLLVNNALNKAISTGEYKMPENTLDKYWDKLDEAFNIWHTKVGGAYYLRALIEVSVVSYEVARAMRQAGNILKDFKELNTAQMERQKG